MIKRDLSGLLLDISKEFRVVAVLGPRQSGKTTLVKSVFKKHTYVSLEDHDTREYALTDPRGFLQKHESAHGIIIDEAQYAPHLFSYIQTIVDRENKRGHFILTGSQNFLLNQSITQSLAGRVAFLTLLPLSISELSKAKLLPKQIEVLFFEGFYPSIYSKEIKPNVDPARFYKNYISSYIERDVRQIVKVGDLRTFQLFMRSCAMRIGQQLNLNAMATDCGISVPTAKAWLSVLEASYMIFLLSPYFKSFNKRLVKSPKLYFYDTAIACSLLGLDTIHKIETNPIQGAMFESMMISDIYKNFYNVDRKPSVYYWRDLKGEEVDCLIDAGTHMIPIEIKFGKTPNMHFFDGLNFFSEISAQDPSNNFVVYAGDERQTRKMGKMISWRSISEIMKKLD